MVGVRGGRGQGVGMVGSWGRGGGIRGRVV